MEITTKPGEELAQTFIVVGMKATRGPEDT